MVVVWGCMSAAGTGEMRLIEGIMDSKMYCGILKQNMKPSLQKLGRTAVFQHDNDPKHTSKMTRAGFTYGQDWAVAQGPPQPGGLHIFHGKKL